MSRRDVKAQGEKLADHRGGTIKEGFWSGGLHFATLAPSKVRVPIVGRPDAYLSDAAIATPCAHVQNTDLAEEIWALSERAVGGRWLRDKT